MPSMSHTATGSFGNCVACGQLITSKLTLQVASGQMVEHVEDKRVKLHATILRMEIHHDCREANGTVDDSDRETWDGEEGV